MLVASLDGAQASRWGDCRALAQPSASHNYQRLAGQPWSPLVPPGIFPQTQALYFLLHSSTSP